MSSKHKALEAEAVNQTHGDAQQQQKQEQTAVKASAGLAQTAAQGGEIPTARQPGLTLDTSVHEESSNELVSPYLVDSLWSTMNPQQQEAVSGQVLLV